MIIVELLISTSLMGLAILFWNFVINKWKKYGYGGGGSACNSDTKVIVVGEVTNAVKEVNDEGYEESTSSKCSSSSVSGRESLTSNTPLSSTPGSPRTVGSGLSRRQKKNRKRDKEENKVKKSSTPPAALSRTNSAEKCGSVAVSGTGSSVVSQVVSSLAPNPSQPQLTRSKKKSTTCKQYDKLSMADHEIYNYFSSYVLSQDQLRQLGFPQESSLHPGKAYIYKDPEFSLTPTDGANNEDGDDCDLGDKRLDANAQPFIPTNNNSKLRWYDSSDSDSSGANLTPERKSSIEDVSSMIPLNVTAKEFVPTSASSISNSVSCPLITSSSTYYNTQTFQPSNKFSVSSDISSLKEQSESEERVCVRCNKPFLMHKDGEYLEAEQCHYHWGKLRTKANVYTCCQTQARGTGSGCSTSPRHVWSGLPRVSGIIGPLQGYVKTKHRKSYPNNGILEFMALTAKCVTPNVG